MSNYLEIGDALNAIPKQVDLNSTQKMPNSSNAGESKIDFAKVVVLIAGTAVVAYLIYEMMMKEQLKVKPEIKD